MDLPFALEGFFFEKVNGSTGQRATFTFHYIIYVPASRHTGAKGPFCFPAAESNSAPFAALHLNGLCRWTSQLLLRGSFSKRSTGQRVTFTFTILYMIADDARLTPPAAKSTRGQRVDGSTGQWVTFTFTILYMIADDARLTPPRCKKHMAYDDTRLTPHHCKKHTAFFACSTGKFPSHTVIQATFICVFVPYLLRGPLADLRQTWWVYIGGPPICP